MYIPDPQSLSKMFFKKYKEDPARFDTLPGTTACWSSVKLVKLYIMASANMEADVVEEGEEKQSHLEMAQELKVERSTLTKKINAMDWKNFEFRLSRLCVMSDEEFIEESAEEHKKACLVKAGLKIRKNNINRLSMMKFLEDTLGNSLEPSKRLKFPPYKPQKHKKQNTPEHAVLLLSDLHVGLEFTKEETGGLNAYNIEIYKQRCLNLRQGVLEILDLHSRMYAIPELHVLCLGDCVQGTNMGGQWGPGYISSTASITTQATICADSISDLLKTWSRYFRNVRFVGIAGNHGRAGAFKNSDKLDANWDNVVYGYVRRDMSEYKNVQVEFSSSWWQKKDINGTEFLMIHGDELKGSVNSIKNTEQKITSLIGSGPGEKQHEIFVAGHFHSHYEIETSNGRILLNGSFIGGDTYSMKSISVRSAPTQTILGVHPRHGMTWKYCLDLSTERK